MCYKLVLPLNQKLFDSLSPMLTGEYYGVGSNTGVWYPIQGIEITPIAIKDTKEKRLLTFCITLDSRTAIVALKKNGYGGIILVDNYDNIYLCEYLCSKPRLISGNNVVQLRGKNVIL